MDSGDVGVTVALHSYGALTRIGISWLRNHCGDT